VGCVRSSNQDAVLAGPTVFAVADGMGGHAAGDVASALAVGALASLVSGPTPAELVEAVRRANTVILDESEPGSGREGMGTTVTGLALGRDEDRDLVLIFNVGDSRTYRSSGDTLTQITVDHSLVAEMVRDGELAPEDAPMHPARNVVTRALGLEGPFEVDLWIDPPTVGTSYLMCSDGLFNEVADAVVSSVLGGEGSPQEKADALIALALDAGAHDNVSVVITTIDGMLEGAPSADDDTNPRGLAAIDGRPEATDTTNPNPALGPDGLLAGPPPAHGGGDT
jgi:protein phosphatase